MIYDTKITYYNDEIQLSCYNYKIIRKRDKEDEDIEQDSQYIKSIPSVDKQLTEAIIEARQIENNKRSMRRTVQTIYEYARSNSWDYFCTFTFDDSVDRYDFNLCKKKLLKFLNNFRNRFVKIEYIVVPELHKDGAIHFHGLIQGDLSEYLTPSFRSGAYHLVKWKNGISDFELCKDSNRAANYITKYITKDLCDISLKRYFVSQGCKRPKNFYVERDTENESIDEYILNNFPEYRMTYIHDVSFGELNEIQYIQLKKRGDNDE